MNTRYIIPVTILCCLLSSCASIKKAIADSRARTEMVTCPAKCMQGIRPDGKRPCDLCEGMGSVTRAQAEEYAR